MAAGQIQEKERVRLFDVCLGQEAGGKEAQHMLCEGTVFRIRSETELEIKLAGTLTEEKLKKTVVYEMYLYTEVQEALHCSVYYRGSFYEEGCLILSLEIISQLERLQRRKYHRVSCHSKLSYKRLSPDEMREWLEEPIQFGQMPGIGGFTQETMVDLSGGGIRFTAKSEVEEEEYLLVQMELPSSRETSYLTVAGRVVCAKPMRNGGGTCDIRMKYLRLPEEQRKQIILFVFQLEKDRMH